MVVVLLVVLWVVAKELAGSEDCCVLCQVDTCVLLGVSSSPFLVVRRDDLHWVGGDNMFIIQLKNKNM